VLLKDTAMLKLHTVLLTLLLGCAALAAHAKPPHDGRGAERDARGLDRAVGQVKRETGGRVLDADVDDHDGDRSYRVKVLTPNGRVRVITVDDENGARQ
jgi:uncharacterized membrane protein YkoI